MMENIKIRDVQLSDAPYLLEIFDDPRLHFWKSIPKTLKEEKIWIKQQSAYRRKNIERNYSIVYNKQIVGTIGIKVYQHRTYCGEIGYIIHPDYWGRGIATQAVAYLEKKLVSKIGLKRIELLTRPGNVASQKVALHNGYKKEGKLKKIFTMKDGSMQDAYLYAKTF